MAAWLLLTSEICGLNSVIISNLVLDLLTVNSIEKLKEGRPEMAHFLTDEMK